MLDVEIDSVAKVFLSLMKEVKLPRKPEVGARNLPSHRESVVDDREDIILAVNTERGRVSAHSPRLDILPLDGGEGVVDLGFEGVGGDLGHGLISPVHSVRSKVLTG